MTRGRQPSLGGQVLKHIWKYYKKYIGLILLTWLLLFGQAFSELWLPSMMSDIIDYGIIKGNMNYIYVTGLKMVIVAVITCACTLAGCFTSAKIGAGVCFDIRRDVFDRVTSFSTAEMREFSTASLITRSTNDIHQIQMTSIMFFRLACFAPLMGIGAMIMALNTSVKLSWTIMAALAAVLILMLFSFRVTFPKFKVVQKMIDRLNLVMGERLSGILVIRAFNTELAEEKRFDEANRDMMKLNLFVNRAMSLMMPTMMLIMNLSGILIVWVGAGFIDMHELQVGEMLAFIQYAMHIIISFMFISMMFIFIPRAVVSAGRVGEILVCEPTVKDAEDAKPFGVAASPETGKNASKGMRVEFQNVSFRYPDAAENMLSNISFTAEPGTTTAIIGSTGSGKSTLVNLILRFYDVTEGRILLNGEDIKTLRQADLRDRIGYIPQKGILFSGTIESNLRYADANLSSEDLLESVRIAQAEDFVFSKPGGLSESVAQGGTNVSGGQKQRLSIARALAKKAPLYIFDDSFSALDFKTDAALRKAIRENMGEATLLIVAQRISTIRDADRIVVLDDGNIAGMGTHSELLESCGVYREIAESQLSREEL